MTVVTVGMTGVAVTSYDSCVTVVVTIACLAVQVAVAAALRPRCLRQGPAH